jgi:two-component system chemotaxis sensor kinase CheA
MDDILKEFLVESHEHLDRMESDLVALEKDPDDNEVLARIFRAVHTIKGTCGFFGMPRLEALSHAGENVLTRLLGGEMRFGPAVVDVLLRLVDAIRGILAEIEKTGGEGEPDVADLIAELELFAAEGAVEEPVADADAAPAPESTEAVAAPPAAAQTVRIDVKVLDSLMNLVGELVLARNQIAEFTETQKESAFSGAAQQLNRITTDLQEAVVQARMEPVGRIWSKFPRVVRDLAGVFGKRVRIEMRGRDTELDRTILEAISDPLTHLLRNSLDHGLEAPGARAAAGKPEEGSLHLGAYQEGGYVVIELRDDGAGIDPRKIKREAIERGVLTAEEARGLSIQETLDLVFRPGFTTATEVTSVSGRGVGMDVVKSNIERVGGAVDLESRPGQGTTVRIRLPLTLAIISGMIVRTAGRRFVIPQAHLRELHRLEGTERIESVHDAPVFRVRGRLLPLVYLDAVLGLRTDDAPQNGETVFIAVLETEEQRFGLVVDRILDTQETVVKPLGMPLERIPVYAGATILGDGAVALILDVAGLAERAGITGAPGAARDDEEEEEEPVPAAPTKRFLLVQGPDDGRVVLPLDMITRLEEFPVSKIELAGERPVVNYRDKVLPLIRVTAILSERRRSKRHPDVTDTAAERKVLQVAVHTRGERSVGLVLERILDVVDVSAELQTPGSRAGVKGTLLVRGRVAEYVDVEHLVRLADPEFFKGAK